MENELNVSGKILEILQQLSKRLAVVPRKPSEEERLHARIATLIKFFTELSGYRAIDLGEWIEEDAENGSLFKNVQKYLGPLVVRPRLISRVRMGGIPLLRSPPKKGTIQRLQSPSGAHYSTSSLLSHLGYIAVSCAEALAVKVSDDFEENDEQVSILARGIYRAVAEASIEHYENSPPDRDDEIDLRPAQRTFQATVTHAQWRNIGTEIETYLTKEGKRHLQGRQLSAAFLLGDKPTLPTVYSSSARRAATDIALAELKQATTPIGIWVRGAVGSGKSTILYQVAISALQQGYKPFLASGLTLGRLGMELFAEQVVEMASEPRTLILIDNAEFLGPEILLKISEMFSQEGSQDLSPTSAMILATQTERLGNVDLRLLRRFAQGFNYANPELRRDAALYADRMLYSGFRPDVGPLAELIVDSALVKDARLSGVEQALARCFNERSNPLLLGAMLAIIEGDDIRERIRASVHDLSTRNPFRSVPGLDMAISPIIIALSIIALCRFRYSGIYRRKFFCDENLITSVFKDYFEIDAGTARQCAKGVVEILWDEVFFEVQYVSAAASDPRRFRRARPSQAANRMIKGGAAETLGGLIDTRHPGVTEAIYASLFRPSPSGVPPLLSEVEMSAFIGKGALDSAISTNLRAYEHARTFLKLGKSFDSRVRDGYYDFFLEWAARDDLGPNAADLAARFGLDAARSFIDSLFELRAYPSEDPDRPDWLADRSKRALALGAPRSWESWRAAELDWLRTELTIQELRLAQLSLPEGQLIKQLRALFDNKRRAMTPNAIATVANVIRRVPDSESQSLAEAGILDAFEEDCASILSQGEPESVLLMELGRYVRDVRPFPLKIEWIEESSRQDQDKQVEQLFNEALASENLRDVWFSELFSFSQERGRCSIGEFCTSAGDESFGTLRGILRTGLRKFENSVRLHCDLAHLEISVVRSLVEAEDVDDAMEILGDEIAPERHTVRRLVRNLIEIQAEKLPTSISRDLMPVLREFIQLEFDFGRIKGEPPHPYSLGWWLELYIGGGVAGRFSLAAPEISDVHGSISERELLDLALGLWKRGCDDNPNQNGLIDSVGQTAAGLLTIVVPTFQLKSQHRNLARGYTLALEILERCSLLPIGADWFTAEVLRLRLQRLVALMLSSTSRIAAGDRDLLLAAAEVLHDPNVSNDVAKLGDGF